MVSMSEEDGSAASVHIGSDAAAVITSVGVLSSGGAIGAGVGACEEAAAPQKFRAWPVVGNRGRWV